MNQCSSCDTGGKNQFQPKISSFRLGYRETRGLKGNKLNFPVVGLIFPLIPRGPHLSHSVTTDCLRLQLRPVYSPFPSAVEDAYVTQHRTPAHQRCCVPQNNLSALLFPGLAFPVLSPAFSVVFVYSGAASAASAASQSRLPKAALNPGFEFVLCETRRSETKKKEREKKKRRTMLLGF